MADKHTPGPWVISANNPFLIRAGDSETGRHIAQAGPANYHPSFAIDEPNARLIAAAPELLEALEELRDLMQGVIEGDYAPDSFTLQVADAAIAKARGDQ